MGLPHISLTPSLLQKDELESFSSDGNILSTAVSSRGNSLAVFPARNISHHSKKDARYASDIFIASWDQPLSDSKRKFISDTFVTMTKFNKDRIDHRRDQSGFVDEESHEEELKFFSSIADEYLIALKMEKERLDEQDPWPEAEIVHTETLYAIFRLFQAIRIPSNGSLDGLVGEELLEWLNTNFIAPDSDEAIELSKLSTPWLEDRFWRYLVRCILRGILQTSLVFLEILTRHPSALMRHQALTLSSLLSSHPRSTNFATEQDFFHSWRQWKNRILVFKKKLESISDQEGGDWLSWLLEIARILDGDKTTIKRYCDSYEEGWKEAICVWGVWVDVGLRRHSLSDLCSSILGDLPLDSTLPEENIFATIFTGETGELIKRANEFSIWLVAHLADMMQPLDLLLKPEEAEMSIRDFCLMHYADNLLVDPSLWRIAVLYMCECGEEGKLRADEVLLRVPLDLGRSKGKGKASDQKDAMDADDEDVVDGRVKEILEICKEHGRESVRREICRIAARTFTEMGQYALAISYYTSAEDWPGIGRVVDLMLAKSIVAGPKIFVGFVLEVAPTLQHPSTYGQSIFQQRLSFLIRYAEFHTRWSNGDIQDAAWDIISMFRDEVVPRYWWGMVLKHAGELLIQDADIMPFHGPEIYELLQRLEEIQARVAQGCGAEYLGALMCQQRKGGEREALRQLESVRLALARYFARCSVLAVGGKGSIVTRAI